MAIQYTTKYLIYKKVKQNKQTNKKRFGKAVGVGGTCWIWKIVHVRTCEQILDMTLLFTMAKLPYPLISTTTDTVHVPQFLHKLTPLIHYLVWEK